MIRRSPNYNWKNQQLRGDADAKVQALEDDLALARHYEAMDAARDAAADAESARLRYLAAKGACSDLDTGGLGECNEGFYCERHYREAAAEHAWLAGRPFSVVTGKLDETQEQELRDAGRGHLLPP